MIVLYALLAILVLGLLILVHEWGHFIAARWIGVPVLEFGIGFPPRALTLGMRRGTRFTLNWIPVGGFVLLAGEEDAAVAGGLAQQKRWKRALVLAAGSLMNLLLAFFLFSGLALVPHQVSRGRIGLVGIIPGTPAAQAGLRGRDILLEVNGRPVRDEHVLLELALNAGRPTVLTIERAGLSFTCTVTPTMEPIHHGIDRLGVERYLYEQPAVTLTRVFPDRPAYRAGLRNGDVVVALNGHVVADKLDFWETLTQEGKKGGPLHFVVRREGQVLPTITVYPPPPDAEDPSLGFGQDPPTEWVALRLDEALRQGVSDTAEAIWLVPRILVALARGAVPITDLAGPLGIVQATAEVASYRQAVGLVRLTGMLSANLFVVNLLPLPALDGGRLALLLLEWLRGGRRLPRRVEGWINRAGMALLLAFLALVTVFDLFRLLGPVFR